MSFSSRILGVLERELSKQLSFTFCELTVDDPARLSLQDSVGFTVWIRNEAEFPLGTIWGLIEPTRITQFRPVRFRIDRLEPRESRKIATVHAMVVGRPHHGTVLDQLGKVDVSATADLSEIVFAEWDKPLVFAPTPQLSTGLPERRPAVAPAPRSQPTERRAIPFGALPLSEVEVG